MTQLKKPVSRKCQSQLPHTFGPDRGKRVVVTLHPGRDGTPDLIELRPERTRRSEIVALVDVYAWAIRCRVNRGKLEKAREKKAQMERTRVERKLRRESRLAAKREALNGDLSGHCFV